MSARIDTDILVSGGGVAGLTAAAAFGSAGFRVICVDPEPPVTTMEAAGADLRTTAFLQPSLPVLQAAGLWDRLAPHAAPLQVMRIIDAGGPQPEPRIIKDFDAAEISDQPFGWNLPNWLLRREMVARLADLPQVDFRLRSRRSLRRDGAMAPAQYSLARTQQSLGRSYLRLPSTTSSIKTGRLS